jgi:hypothetical protein
MINLDYDVLYAFLGSFVFYLMLIWKGLLFLDPGLIVPCILWEEKERIYIYIYRCTLSIDLIDPRTTHIIWTHQVGPDCTRHGVTV